ncbi:MAG: SDR family oxidoreductase [Acidobacteriia bacterium]|nr:SDR family oxidoreductase [Terriglobia bacterium]
MKNTSLQNKIAVVTGGGRGIGRAIALELASAGAAVAVIARSQPELAEAVALIEKAGGRASAFFADVANPQAVQTTFQEIEQSLGPVDILVNNAATVQPLGPFWETSVENWWYGMELNIHGPLMCTHAVLPGMIARRCGHIINIASGAGTVSTTFFSSYVTSKTALIRWTECLALETREHGIACFSLEPGTVRTSMAEYALNSPEGRKWLPWFPRIFDQKIDVPPERAARLVLELASGRIDALSGRFLTIYEDLDALLQRSEEIKERNLYSLKLERLTESNAGLNTLKKAANLSQE